jgi:hypothetical protein
LPTPTTCSGPLRDEVFDGVFDEVFVRVRHRVSVESPDVNPDPSARSLAAFWDWLGNTDLAFEIGATWWFPLLESIHVIAVALVVGSIFMVDLRLLGVAARAYPISTVTRELTPWSWAGFVIATVTGAGMFIVRPAAYAENPAFQVKLLLLVLAGLNVAVFHVRALRDVARWDTATATPVKARLAGAVSLLLWAGAILAGRWTGHLN